jgi:PA14 domain
MPWVVFGMLLGLLQAQDTAQQPMAKFGTTVVRSIGLRGDIYLLEPGTKELPNFKKLHSAGTIYTNMLNVPPTDFTQGFPGVTDRFEWFAIDYSGRFWIDRPGRYTFALLSDDGSKLYIDNHLVIDNDGTHPPLARAGRAHMKSGMHQMRVSYFQGPRYQVALVLSIAGPGESFRLFNADEFIPPADAADGK